MITAYCFRAVGKKHGVKINSALNNGVAHLNILGGHQLPRPLYSGRSNPLTSHLHGNCIRMYMCVAGAFWMPVTFARYESGGRQPWAIGTADPCKNWSAGTQPWAAGTTDPCKNWNAETQPWAAGTTDPCKNWSAGTLPWAAGITDPCKN